MDLYGRPYVIEHCMNAYLQTMEERRYRAYLTDALMIITENTAKFAGGKHLTQRWVDQFKPVDNNIALVVDDSLQLL